MAFHCPILSFIYNSTTIHKLEDNALHATIISRFSCFCHLYEPRELVTLNREKNINVTSVYCLHSGISRLTL